MPRFTPNSILGKVWKEIWAQKDLGAKEPEEVQNEYVAFCVRYNMNVKDWEPIEPYPVPS